MSEMIERAARALFTPYTAKDGIYSFFFKSYDAVLLAKDDDDGAALHLRHLDRAARAALSAALDEDALYEMLAAAILPELDYGNPRKEDVAVNVAVAALRALKSSCASDQVQDVQK